MNAIKNQLDQRTYSSHCRFCGKLLTKPMVQIEIVALTVEEYRVLMRGVRIRYGAQSKCRNCKKLRDTLREFEPEGAVAVLAAEKPAA